MDEITKKDRKNLLASSATASLSQTRPIKTKLSPCRDLLPDNGHHDRKATDFDFIGEMDSSPGIKILHRGTCKTRLSASSVLGKSDIERSDTDSLSSATFHEARNSSTSTDWPPIGTETSSASSIIEPPGKGNAQELDANIAALVRQVSRRTRRKAGAQVDLSLALGLYHEVEPRPASATEVSYAKRDKDALIAMDVDAVQDHLCYLHSKLNLVNLELKAALDTHDMVYAARERLDEEMADVLTGINEHNEIAAYVMQRKQLAEMLAQSRARHRQKGWFR